MHAADALRETNQCRRPEQFSVSERERRPHRARLMPTVRFCTFQDVVSLTILKTTQSK